MTLRTFEKWTVFSGNLVNPTDVTSVIDTGITAFVTGFPLSNLEYPDAWTMMKTNGVVGDPTIEFNFGTTVAPNCLGIINHNLGRDENNASKYGTVDVEHWNGISYDIVASANIVGNKDILIPFNPGTPQSKHRFTLNAVTTSDDFFIGSVFWGTGTREMVTNPAANSGMVHTRTIPVVVEESAGGAKHISHGAKKRSGELEVNVVRGDRDDLGSWVQLDENELIGVLGCEISDMGSASPADPVGDGIFWGYLVDRVFSPQGPGQSLSTPRAKYDYTLYFVGAY